jgi:hypothetical protein
MKSHGIGLFIILLTSGSVFAQQNQIITDNVVQDESLTPLSELTNQTEAGEPLTAAPQKQTSANQNTSQSGIVVIEDTIRVSREQPKVLSIVPWQPPSDKASLPSPFVKRIEQDFMPLERGEFIRQVQHFERLSGKAQK